MESTHLKTDHFDVDKATIHQWPSSSSLKGETEGSYSQLKTKVYPHGYTKQECSRMVLTLILDYAQRRKKQ